MGINSTWGDTQPNGSQRGEQPWIVPNASSIGFSRTWAGSIAPNNPLETLRFVESGGYPGRLRVAVVGSGGIGDLLELADVAELLKRNFAPCNVILFHQNLKAPSDVTDLNPNVAASLIFSGDRETLINSLKGAPFFDVIVAARYTLEFMLTQDSCVDAASWKRFVSQANLLFEKWKPFASYYPFSNNALGRELQAIGRNIYDCAALSSGIIFNNLSPPALFPQVEAYARAKSLIPKPYITVHNGFDRTYMEGKYENGYESTKSLPLPTWAKVVSALASEGFKTVQLGLVNDTPIPGVSYDLRGSTTFSEMAFVLKGAQCHIDTEGGLVHVARRVNQRAVVMFGPTSAKLFGYNGNINLVSQSCGDCWWTRPDWTRECPRRTQGPECMLEHTTSSILAAVKLIVTSNHRVRRYELLRKVDDIESPCDVRKGPTISQELRDFVADILQNELADLQDASNIAYITNMDHSAPAFDICKLGHNVSLFQVDASAASEGVIGPSHARFSHILNIPSADQTFDLVICIVNYNDRWPFEGVIEEICRIVKSFKVVALIGWNFPSDSKGIPERIAENHSRFTSHLSARLFRAM